MAAGTEPYPPRVHNSLTEHARCLYGDAYRPAPACPLGHREHYLIEELTCADADAVLALLHELSPRIVDGNPPVWARNLAYRPALPQRPDAPALLREAAQSLRLHGPDWDDVAADLTARADTLEAS